MTTFRPVNLWVKAALVFVLAWAAPTARAAEAMLIFGLTNQSINGATLIPRDPNPGLHVDGLSDLGYKGLSVALGKADSGLFFSPQVGGFITDSNFMHAHAFGRVSGLDRRICSVFGYRNGYGIYPVSVDFTPLGALTQTIQVYCDGLLVREETNRVGAVDAVTFHTDSAGNIYPRVNPFWRADDGSVGVLIEFNLSPVSLPGGAAYGNRVFIKPERPLFSVEYVSRAEIYGGGGLPNFEAWAEALGAFNLPHTALGSAVFSAKPGELTLGGLGTSGEDGVMVELGGASSYEMRLQPLALPTNALVQFSARGIGESYFFRGREFIGPVSLRNNDGTVEVSGTFGGSVTNRVRLSVFNQGVFTGGATNTGGTWGSIPDDGWQVLACGAKPASGGDPSSVSVTFDTPVTFQPAGGGDPLIGDELRFSWQDPGPDNGGFKNFQLQAAGVPAFTITNRVLTPASPPMLSIAHSGDQVQVSWPYLSGYSYLEVGHTVDGTNWFTNSPPAQLVGSRWQVNFDLAGELKQFFRLNNWCRIVNAALAGNGN